MAECHSVSTTTRPGLRLRHPESPGAAKGTLPAAAGCSQEQLLFAGMDSSARSTVSL